MTGTSFENLTNGFFSAELDDDGLLGGYRFWLSSETESNVVVPYGTGEAYDYARSGTVRQPLFAEEPHGSQAGRNLKYLDVDSVMMLERTIMPRLEDESGRAIVSNVFVTSTGYTNIYADALVRFTSSTEPPDVTSEDRIVVWLREAESGGEPTTNLMVTAGFCDQSFNAMSVVHYPIAEPQVAPDTWHRVTIKTVADMTAGAAVPGFVVYVDGRPAVGASGYAIHGSGIRRDWFTPESRMLIGERRLFPWIVGRGTVSAFTLSRLSLSGIGAVDDILFTTERPAHVSEERVFSLRWDGGVSALTCVIATGDGRVTTNEVDMSGPIRLCDLSLGTNETATVTVDARYRGDLDFTNGLWSAEGCLVSGNVFTYVGGTFNPAGRVTSARDVVGVGTNAVEGYATTFRDALALARSSGVRTIELMTDMKVPYAADGDPGYLTVLEGDDFILDLNGHALVGTNPRYETISQSGGRLRIVDTSEAASGSVLPSRAGVAVKSYGTADRRPELIVEAGTYEGEVVVTGKVSVINGRRVCHRGACLIGGGRYRSEEGTSFYLEQYVTNTTAYYAYREPYWQTVTNGFIWTGGAAPDNRWTTAGNWKSGSVPGAGDLAIFPDRGGSAWPVDVGEGVATKALWLDADIEMAGTNEFSDVTVVAGRPGRLTGSGVACFTGRLPGALTAEDSAATEIRLADGWSGTVRVGGIVSPQILKNIAYWGTSASRLEFNGVRGYISDTANRDMPFGLILTDAGTTPAWRNDTGYTGSTITFAALSGTGTLESPANFKKVLQVLHFRDASAFTGAFAIMGKRVLLGTGVIRSSAAGLVSFSDAARVRSGLDWRGVTAEFGPTLGVTGLLGDALMSFTGDAPDVSGVVVTLTDPETGAETTRKLAVRENQVVVVAQALTTVNGVKVAPGFLASRVRSGSFIEVEKGSSVSIVGNDVIVDGVIVSTIAAHYDVCETAAGSGVYTVGLNAAATPMTSEFRLEENSGVVSVIVLNVKAGFWYGLQHVKSLAEKWPEPATWVQATADGELYLEGDSSGTSGFYRVQATDALPKGGAE